MLGRVFLSSLMVVVSLFQCFPCSLHYSQVDSCTARNKGQGGQETKAKQPQDTNEKHTFAQTLDCFYLALAGCRTYIYAVQYIYICMYV